MSDDAAVPADAPPASSAGSAVDLVLLASPRGFCAGVEMAIKALAWMVRSFAPPVYCYHEIVHNKLVVDRFEALGVIFVDEISDVPPGRPIMLSAHGSAPAVVVPSVWSVIRVPTSPRIRPSDSGSAGRGGARRSVARRTRPSAHGVDRRQEREPRFDGGGHREARVLAARSSLPCRR